MQDAYVCDGYNVSHLYVHLSYCTVHDQFEYGMMTTFLEGFCGLPQTYQGTVKAATTDPSPTYPLTLAGAFPINIYISHKTVLLASITIRAPTEHLSNQFSSHSFHIDNTNNVIFPPLVSKFTCSSNQVNGASKSFNNGNIVDAVSTCTTD
jgi:hypothetical protein